MPVGGSLSGTLPYPSLSFGGAIQSQVFGPRVGAFGNAVDMAIQQQVFGRRLNLGLGQVDSPQFATLYLNGSAPSIQPLVDDGTLFIYGGTPAGSRSTVSIKGPSAASNPGYVSISARDSVPNTQTLEIPPTGNMTWSGSYVGSGTIQGTRLISTIVTGTAPLTVASTTKVTNLNADLLDGADWAAPAAIGSTTPAAGSFTTLSATGDVTFATLGKRIKFYTNDVTRANRTLLTENTVDGGFNAGAIPNGTSNTCAFTMFGASDPDNAQAIQIVTTGTGVTGVTAINATKFGTGTQRPLALQIAAVTKTTLNTDSVLSNTGLVAVALTAAENMAIPADYGVIVPDRYVIPSGINVDLGAGAVLEIT